MLNGAGGLPVGAGAASVAEGAIAIVEAKRKPSLRFMSVILCWLLLKAPTRKIRTGPETHCLAQRSAAYLGTC